MCGYPRYNLTDFKPLSELMLQYKDDFLWKATTTKKKTAKNLSQINNQIVQSLCNSLANSVPNSVLNSVVSLTRHTFTNAVQPLCCANEMNILRAFLCRYFFRTINTFSRMFARKYNNGSNLFTHAQIRPTLFLKIFNDIVVRCYSSTERLRIACVSWKLRKVKLPGWLYEQFRGSG